jgi:anaerobic magnesium-protoporphyrin IX monomethyl ester cyclase
MKKAGCERVFFGIESGNDDVLREMRKRISVAQARQAVDIAVQVGLKAAAFFIIGSPGENNSTIMQTIKFATRLPLDYLSFSIPYPIPGTGLYERVKNTIREQDPNHSRWSLLNHSLIYDSDFSEFKLKFGIAKASVQHRLQKHTGRFGYSLLGTPFEFVTDLMFEKLK